MARLTTSGFEENNFTATMWSAVTGTPTITTSTPHSGTYCFECENASTASKATSVTFTGVTSGTHYTRVYYRKVSSNWGGTTIILQNASSESWKVNHESNGKLTLTNIVTTTAVTTTAALSLDTWYRIEVRHLVANTGGEIEMRYYLGDDTAAIETLSITNEDTLATSFTRYTIGKNGGSGQARFDDFAVNDATGSFQTSWCGPAKCVTRVPNGDTSVAWTDATGTETGNWGEVNDLPGAPDDDTSYNTSSTANQEDRYGLTAMPAEVTSDADILLVDVYARIRGEGTTGTRQCRVLLWDEGGSQTNGPTTALNDSTAYAIMGIADHLVYDPGTKTKANLDSFDAGAEPLTSHATRLTALWVNVEWIEATAAADDTRTRGLLMMMGTGV